LRCYLFDLDGNLADLTCRLRHVEGGPAFIAGATDDQPVSHLVELARHLAKMEAAVFFSGRSEDVRTETESWLKEQGLSGALYMRRRNDTRPDHIVKAELLDRILADGFEPIMTLVIATKA
jgi:hypothetical protein